jgi:calcineurin-like phosphoesterase family protein
VRFRCAGLVLLLGIGTRNAPAASKIARDWTKYPAIVQIDTGEDIFAIGDVHADYDRLVKLLAAAKIIERPASPEAIHWTAGKAILVFTGDLVDKGPHSLQVVQLAASLRKAAAGSGGQVVTIMGNHEAEFLADPTEKKVKDFAQDIRRVGLMPKEVAACRGEVGQFLCSLPFGARVDDWFFSHGGNTGGRTISQLVADFQNGVGKDGFGSPQLIDPNSMLEARIGEEGPGGKAWFEVERPQRSAEQLLGSYVAALGVNHLVQGHQHQKIVFEDGQHRNTGQMFQWHGLIFLIDVGMSEGVGDSRGAVLHIRHKNGEEASAIDADGKETSLWKSQR